MTVTFGTQYLRCISKVSNSYVKRPLLWYLTKWIFLDFGSRTRRFKWYMVIISCRLYAVGIECTYHRPSIMRLKTSHPCEMLRDENTISDHGVAEDKPSPLLFNSIDTLKVGLRWIRCNFGAHSDFQCVRCNNIFVDEVGGVLPLTIWKVKKSIWNMITLDNDLADSWMLF